jgi:large subunit ribosomal protein L17
MRHRKKRSKLSMMTAHRNATLRNMVRSLFKYQRIRTIVARAKETRRIAEHLISISKTDSVTARRRVYDVLADRDLVMKLFKEITPLFKTKNSGFTRIIPLGFRRGDGASLCILELTERKIVEKLPKKKKEKAEKPAVEKEGQEKEEHVHEPKIKTMPKAKPILEEGKKAEKAKSEDRKASQQRGFMKNIRGLFRKRGDR